MPFSGNIGSDWGGEYSRWIFDETKAYMLVAKMMREPGTLNGVPLLDAEMNEQGEILLQLIRRLISRIYGNGTTNNGFKIAQSGTNTNNNFTIKGGDGTMAGAGSLFVDGWMPFNLSDVEYTDQDFGPEALTTPTADRTDEVYIDVYYDEIDSSEDSSIEDSSIGLETSRRIALIWEVKVVEGGSTPAAYTDTNNVYHWTMKLATLARLSGNATITSAMITDNRNDARKISLASELTAEITTRSTQTAALATQTAALATADSAHAALTSPHSATSAATANRLIVRDSSGRAKVAAPSASTDIARLDTVTGRGPKRYICAVSYTGAFSSNPSAPSGWTVSRSSTGVYIITHNLGHVSYVANAIPYEGMVYGATVTGRANNSIQVNMFATNTGTSTNVSFYFTLDEVA